MAIIYVPKNIRESGQTTVREAPSTVHGRIEYAKQRYEEMIVLHEVWDHHDTRLDTELRIKWSLIQAVDPEPAVGPV